MSSIMRNKIDNVNHKVTPVTGEDDALELVHRVMHAYRSLQYRALRDGPHDITHMDSKVLGFFSRHPGATQSDLAQHSGRDKAQLARLVKGLRDRGLLEAQVDEADRRNVRLSLTTEGHALQRSLQKQALRVGASAVAGLTAVEHRQLCALLRHVLGNLDEPS
jgi:DNA-binding MarR family transcriptional regulator